MITRINHQTFRLYDQEGKSGYCGIAALRSVLATQFNLEIEGERLHSEICSFYASRYNQGNLREGKAEFAKRGTSPKAIAHCLRSFSGIELKVFCSKKGTLELLNNFCDLGLLPVIHALVSYDDESAGGHYLSFLGRKEKVYIFDPAPGEGLKKLSPEEFNEFWYNPADKERWFLAALPSGLRPGFSYPGKYI